MIGLIFAVPFAISTVCYTNYKMNYYNQLQEKKLDKLYRELRN